ncbi:hypothetical protein HMPREF0484_3288 [Klebsiella pneumoniae subsp. rhinoscleromatis ATCC 13884]|nr:hypothetical protein HMPREF0484_3288 [Klebsiella pneumoniae subsp. rhinoscleromatis ATCC 13884]
MGQRLFIFWHTRGRKLAACIFDFYYTTLFLPPGKSVMWLRLDAARHVTGWFETIF